MNVGGPCAISGCRRSAQFNSVLCYKHRNELPPIEIHSIDSAPDDISEIKNQLIRFEIDGNQNSIDSKELDNLLNRIKKAKKFWIVDLTENENEFVQYAIDKGQLEHWEKSEMIESMEMTSEEAFATLRTKITGTPSEDLFWWSNEIDDSKNEESGLSTSFAFAMGISILAILILLLSKEPEMVLGNFIGEAVFQGICWLILLAGGAGASTLNRKDSGKFSK